MATVTICSDFGAQENEIVTASSFSPSICHGVMGLHACHDHVTVVVVLMLSLRPAFSLSSFTLIRGSLVPLHSLPLK